MNQAQPSIVQLSSPPSVQSIHERTAPSLRQARANELYDAEGGPLIGWILSEARQRDQRLHDMSAQLGVTYGYIHQLRTGARKTCNISREFARSCANYLGVPPIVVRLLAGQIDTEDFLLPEHSEERLVERALHRMMEDPMARALVSGDVRKWPLEAKRSLVRLYSDSVGHDLLGIRFVPEMVQWLESAAKVHLDNEAWAELRNFG